MTTRRAAEFYAWQTARTTTEPFTRESRLTGARETFWLTMNWYVDEVRSGSVEPRARIGRPRCSGSATASGAPVKDDDGDPKTGRRPVSYTHLTLPTILRV